MMRPCLLLALGISACAGRSNVEPPLASGDYTFAHRFAEHPNIPSIELAAQIRGRHIVLINNDGTDVFPRGIIAKGTLTWHAASSQWIISREPTDADAAEVGGCSGGPEVVDLQHRVYWTC
jgi:hypothetical protein